MKKNKGFTIIELIISIFILSIAVVGIFNALSIIIILTSDSTDRLTATYLAQEAMEIVRNIRDTNWLNIDNATPGNPGTAGANNAYSWLDGLASKDDGADNNPMNCKTQICEADYTSKNMSYYSPEDYLLLNANGFYVQKTNDESAVKTKFERKISITPLTDVDNVPVPYHIIDVKAEVSWDKKATIFTPFVSADLCCPSDSGCPANKSFSNCITTEETLYNWYNIAVSVIGVEITDGSTGETDSDLQDTVLTLDKTATITDSLAAVINPQDATNTSVSWSSDTPSVATVDGTTGLVTAVSAGTATITVTTSDGQKTATDFITVNDPSAT